MRQSTQVNKSNQNAIMHVCIPCKIIHWPHSSHVGSTSSFITERPDYLIQAMWDFSLRVPGYTYSSNIAFWVFNTFWPHDFIIVFIFNDRNILAPSCSKNCLWQVWAMRNERNSQQDRFNIATLEYDFQGDLKVNYSVAMIW